MTATAPMGGSDTIAPDAPAGGARLLAEMPGSGTSRSLAEHRQRHPVPPASTGRPQQGLIEEVERAGLRGRGGAGFPTAIKLAAVAERRGPSIVVVNGTEGEPASGKDKLLLSGAPHLVLDGAQWAAAAVGATEIVVAIDRTATTALRQVQRAVAERAGERRAAPIRVEATPPRYLAGEESALIHWLNGGPAKPTLVPPRPFEKGVNGRPTLVDNVETLAHLAQISRWGAGWFRTIGTEDEAGTALVTVSGGVDRPGVYEAPLGASLSRILTTAGAVPLSAVLVGGYFGTWIDAKAAEEVAFSRAGFAPLGASVGCGAIVALPQDACGVHDSARVLNWLAAETAGQCGPCVHGLAAVASTFSRLYYGKGGRQARDQLYRWAGMIEGRGACRHPDGAIRFLRSALATFDRELAVHATTGHCSFSQRRPVLPLPTVTKDPEWR